MSRSRDYGQSRDINHSAGIQRMDRGSAFSGMNQGSASRSYSQRGSMSRGGGGGGRMGGGRR